LCNTISITGIPFFIPMILMILSLLNIIEFRGLPNNVPKEYLLIESLVINKEYYEKFLLLRKN